MYLIVSCEHHIVPRIEQYDIRKDDTLPSSLRVKLASKWRKVAL